MVGVLDGEGVTVGMADGAVVSDGKRVGEGCDVSTKVAEATAVSLVKAGVSVAGLAGRAGLPQAISASMSRTGQAFRRFIGLT
jgi:tetrahydrodipicolinate N-succinyltransferase